MILVSHFVFHVLTSGPASLLLVFRDYCLHNGEVRLQLALLLCN